MPTSYPIGGRVQRLLKGMGALSVGGLVSLVAQIVVVPAALHGWGELKYGEWLALSGLIAFLRLGDLGIKSHAVNRLCTAYALEDRESFERIFRSALALHLVSMAAVWVGVGVAVGVVPLGEVLGLRTTSGLDLRLAAIFLAIEVSSAIPGGLVTGMYRATGRLSRGALFGATQQALSVGLMVALVLDGVAFSILAGARLLLTLGLYLWVVRDVRGTLPSMRFSPVFSDRALIASLVVPGLFFLLVAVADYVSMKVTLLAVQMAASGAVVSQFVTHRALANFPRMWGNHLTWVVWPELTALRARGNTAELRRLHRSASRRNLLLVGAVTVVVAPLLPWIYPLWTGGRLTLDPWAMALFFLQTLVWAVWSVSMTLLLAIDRHRLVGPSLLLGAIVTAVATILLVPRWGTLGAAMAALCGDLAGPAWLLPWLASRYLDVSPIRLALDAARTVIRFLLLPLACGIASVTLLEGVGVRVLGVTVSWSLALALLAINLSETEKRIFREGLDHLLARTRTETNLDNDLT